MDKNQLAKYMENPNVKWVLYNILKYESGKINGKVNTGSFNESAGDSTAYGSSQFIGSTRNTILKDYDIDAWSEKLEDQQMAAIALMHSNGDIDAIASGDYSGLKSNNYWEAFSSDKNYKRLTANQPSNWEDDYTQMQSDSIYDPAASWNKLDPSMQKEKEGWYKKKYGKVPGGQVAGKNKQGKTIITVPTEDEATMKSANEALALMNEYTLARDYAMDVSKTWGTPYKDEKKNAELRAKVVDYSKKFQDEKLKRSWKPGDDEKYGPIYLEGLKKELGFDKFNYNNLEDVNEANRLVGFIENTVANEAFGEEIGGDQFLNSPFERMVRDNWFDTGNIQKSLGVNVSVWSYSSKIQNKLKDNYYIKENFNDSPTRYDTNFRPVFDPKSGDLDFDNLPAYRKIIQDKIIEYNKANDPEYNPETTNDQDYENQIINTAIADHVEESGGDAFATPELINSPLIDRESFKKSGVDFSEEYEGFLKQLEDAEVSQEEAKPLLEDFDAFQKWKKDNPKGSYEEYTASVSSAGETIPEGGTDTKTWNDAMGGNDAAFKETFLDKIGGVSSLIGLATGVVGLGQALKEVDIPKDPKLGPAFQQRLEESKRMAQQGLTPSELAKAHNELDSSYAKGIENIVRGSAGNRAQFMAGLGGLDVARQSALMDIAVADAQMQRQNQEKYDGMMMMNEQYEAARESKYNNAKFEQEMMNKQAGAALAGSALSMVSESIGDRQLNQLRKMQTQKMMRDMGYVPDSKGNSAQDKLGTDKDGNDLLADINSLTSEGSQRTGLIEGIKNKFKIKKEQKNNDPISLPSINYTAPTNTGLIDTRNQLNKNLQESEKSLLKEQDESFMNFANQYPGLLGESSLIY